MNAHVDQLAYFGSLTVDLIKAARTAAAQPDTERKVRYVVDGAVRAKYEPDEAPEFAGDGAHAPFVVFDVGRQENLPGRYETRAEAESALLAHVAQEAITTVVGADLGVLKAAHLDPAIRVSTVDAPGFASTWNINMGLSDRWGEVIHDNVCKNPITAVSMQDALAALSADPALLERLQSQMWDETTFIARKDGEFGILFEVEYTSIESDAGVDDPSQEDKPAPYARVVERLLVQAAELKERFPQVDFCVPEAGMVFNERPAIWGFAKDGALSVEDREALGKALYDFAYPLPTDEADESAGMKP